MFKQTLENLTILMGVLSNKNLVALYSHSPAMKTRDAGFMLLLTYTNMAYTYQMLGKLEETLSCISEAEFIVQYLLFDSAEARDLVGKLKNLFYDGVLFSNVVWPETAGT